ncbi:MAG TPA: choice-of-anchor tandem repeat GloVer-containing protein, partial [Verrucomicrobiae bacterium]|nr:choice-of-anchor tandem repeat GloVer-containing protein [Verrucomicrobiae bacterium]
MSFNSFQWVAALLSLFLGAASLNLRAQTFEVLHSFGGALEDGAFPATELFLGKDGNLYGTTSGSQCCLHPDPLPTDAHQGYGTIFKVSPLGEVTTLVRFDLFTNGSNPSPLIQARDGNFYGTT